MAAKLKKPASKKGNHIIVLGRVTEETARRTFAQYGPENVIVSDFGTHEDGEAFFTLFAEPSRDIPYAPELTPQQQTTMAQRLAGAHVTIVTASSGSAHKERKKNGDQQQAVELSSELEATKEGDLPTSLRRSFETPPVPAQHPMHETAVPLRILRSTNATSRGSSQASCIHELKRTYRAASITSINTKIPFDRQDRRFKKRGKKPDGTTTEVSEWNAKKGEEYVEDLRNKGADRIVIFDPHSESFKKDVRRIFRLNWPMIKAFRLQIEDLGPEKYVLDFIHRAAKKLMGKDFGRTFNRHKYRHLSTQEEKAAYLLRLIENQNTGIRNRVFKPERAAVFVYVASDFALNIVTRFTPDVILSNQLVFGPPDGLNKPDDVAVTRARVTRNETYKVAAQVRNVRTLKERFGLNAGDLNHMFLIEKDRQTDMESEVKGFLGEENVPGKIGIIIDDIISGGGTLRNAAAEIKNKGAAQAHAYITHGVLIDNPDTGEPALEKILKARYTDNGRDEWLVDSITITDSVPSVLEKFEALPPDLKSRVHMIAVEDKVMEQIDKDHTLAARRGYDWHTQPPAPPATADELHARAES